MAVINSLVFDDKTGAIVTDEEYWFLRRRKSYFADNLHDLVPPAVSDDLSLAVVYGGVGHPSFHYEVASKTARIVEKRWTQWKESGERTPPFTTVEDVGRIVVEVTQATVRRRVDEKLKFFYGFTTDDFIRGSFETGDRTVKIGQEKVKTRAKAIIEYTEKSPLCKSIYDNVAVLLGWDATHGVGNFHIKAENCVLSMVSGRFEAVGKGMYASAMVLTRFLQNKTLAERRVGLDPVESTVELIKATLEAGTSFHEAGGHCNMMLLDGSKPDHAGRLRLVSHHRMKLATECVQACTAGLIDRKTAEALVRDIVFTDGNLEKAETKLFAAASDAKRLEYLLRGYKMQDWQDGDLGLPKSSGQKPAARASKGK